MANKPGFCLNLKCCLDHFRSLIISDPGSFQILDHFFGIPHKFEVDPFGLSSGRVFGVILRDMHIFALRLFPLIVTIPTFRLGILFWQINQVASWEEWVDNYVSCSHLFCVIGLDNNTQPLLPSQVV